MRNGEFSIVRATFFLASRLANRDPDKPSQARGASCSLFTRHATQEGNIAGVGDPSYLQPEPIRHRSIKGQDRSESAMKSLIAQLLTAAALLTVLACGAIAAVSLEREHDAHPFDNMQASLWTSVPTKIDRSRQSLERLPALAADDTPAIHPSKASLVANLPTATTEGRGHGEFDAQILADDAPANGDQCRLKYRSYRAEDNTYQPFGGGPRRSCQSAADRSPALMQPSQPDQFAADSSLQDHISWCRARYTSYRVSDDTFKPLGGAERRRCQSPFA